jgi:hypothetical protein
VQGFNWRLVGEIAVGMLAGALLIGVVASVVRR